MRAILNVHASRRFRTSALHQVSLLPLLVKTKIMWLLRKTLFQIIVFPKRNGRRISVSWLKSTIPVLNRLLLTRKCVWDVIYVTKPKRCSKSTGGGTRISLVQTLLFFQDGIEIQGTPNTAHCIFTFSLESTSASKFC